MIEVESGMEDITVMDSSDFWEELKQKLEDEMTQNEQERITFLVSDKIKTMCKGTGTIRSMRDLLNILEKSMFYEDALSVLQHAFGYEDFYTEYEDKSLGQMINDYRVGRRRFSCSNIIGREEEIRAALGKLVNAESKGLWIYGMGGLGKTLLANEISERLTSSRNTDVLIFDLKQVTNTGDVIKSILAKFDVFTTSSDTKDLTSELIYQLKDISCDTCILLDNIEDVYKLDTEELTQVLQRCLDGPAYMPVKWIITSRIQIDADIHLPGISEIKLEPLNDRSAEKLLRLSIRPIELEEDKCKQILEMTGRNPLAIRLMSSAVKSNWCRDNFDNFSFLNLRLQYGMKECIEYAYMSLTEVERNQLKNLSVVETSHFDIEIVKAVLDFKDHKDAILLMMKLTNQQIVQTICYGQYCLHPLIFEYLRNRPGREECSIQAQNNFLVHMIRRIEPYIQHADKDYSKAIAKVSGNQSLLKVLLRVLSTRTDDRNNFLTPNVNKYLIQLRDMIPVTQMEKKSLYKNITRQMISSGRLEAYLFWKLEEIRMMLDDKCFAEADKELSDIDIALHDTSDASNFSTDIKGRFWYIKGRFFRCKECKEYTKAIECFSKSHHFSVSINNIPDAAMALNALGNTYFDRKEDDKALSYHQQAFDLLQSFISSDLHPDLSVYEFNIGTIYLAKASKELSIFKCVTVNAKENLENALKIFESSMDKDIRMKTHRTPKYGNKLAEKAKTLFYLSDDDSKRREAINIMKESLTLKIDPFTNPDRNRTLLFFKTGHTFVRWREEVLNDPRRVSSTSDVTDIAKELLKQAIRCFRLAEDDITKSDSASLERKDKADFISEYLKVASQGIVSHKEARDIKSFCERYESGVLFDSSSSSSSSSSEKSSSDREDSESDEGIHSNNSFDEDSGIRSTKIEKQAANHHEKAFFYRISKQMVPSDKDIKKRRRSMSSESD